MNTTESDPLDELRQVAARQSLGLARSWEIPPIADRLVANGVYSPALSELGTSAAPAMADVGPLLERALAELHLPFPSKVEAAWHLADHCIRRIALTAEQPLPLLTLLKDVSYAAVDVLPDKVHVGDGLDLGSLIGIFWSYSEPSENYYAPEQRVIADESERQALLDRAAREESRRWLARHPLGSQPSEGGPVSSEA